MKNYYYQTDRFRLDEPFGFCINAPNYLETTRVILMLVGRTLYSFNFINNIMKCNCLFNIVFIIVLLCCFVKKKKKAMRAAVKSLLHTVTYYSDLI